MEIENIFEVYKIVDKRVSLEKVNIIYTFSYFGYTYTLMNLL